MEDPNVRAAFESVVQRLPPATCALHGQRLDRIEKTVERIEDAIVGNGHPGMRTRIDRLEQTCSAMLWVVRAAFGTAIAALVASIGRAMWKQ
jgi:hypothetical protein